MKNRIFKIMYWLLFIFLFFIFGYSVCLIGNWVKDNKTSQKEIQDITNMNTSNKFPTNVDATNSDNNILNFENLKKTNKDTVAYIDVNLTNIHYPVVQASDNKYYLNHSFMKKKSEAGWVFLDYQNSNNFSDDNTVIYGHNRVDKTMFGSLDELLKKDLSTSSALIYVSLEKEKIVYQIFSVYTIEAEDYYIQKAFNTVEEKTQWINTINKRNTTKLFVNVLPEDKILTLSTCYGNENLRLVVHAKRIL